MIFSGADGFVVPDLPVKPPHGERVVCDFGRPDGAGAQGAVCCLKAAHDAAVLTSERPAAQQKDAAALRKAGPADLDGLITGFVCIRDCSEQRVSLCAEAQRCAADAERENDRNRGKQANSLQ